MKAAWWCFGFVALLAGVLACGKSVQQQCQDGVNATCQLFAKCNDGGATVTTTSTGCTVSAGGFTLNFGVLPDGGPQCYSGLTGENVCAGREDGGGEYNSANADQCLSAIQGATCSQVQSVSQQPPCSTICG